MHDELKAAKPADGGHRAATSGRFLVRLGLVAAPLGAGAAWGYYCADQGATWLTMLGRILVIGAAAFVLLGLGLLLASGRAPRGRSRRALALICLLSATACLAGRLALIWIAQPRPLTALSAEQFELAFETDGQRYRELDGGLEQIVGMLEQRTELAGDDVLSADSERLLLDAWQAVISHAFSLDQIRIFYEDWYRFDASRVQRSYHLRSFLLTFAAELSLYEKGLRLVRLLRRNPHAVKYLDTPHQDRRLPVGSFSTYKREFLGARDRSRVVTGRGYLRWLDQGLRGRLHARSLGCGWLWNRVERHLALIQVTSPLEKDSLGAEADLMPLKRALRRAWFPAQRAVAEWMGDTRVRRIGSYLITVAQQEQMNRRLQPGDIMLSRKNWYLSNVGLPGFWPHALLYIGGPEKLASYFDDAQVRAHLHRISGEKLTLGDYLKRRFPTRWRRYLLGQEGRPYRVIEAISEGVVFNTLDHAAGDYLAALRPRLTKRAKAKAVIEAFGHLDKPYDFDFDFATAHALVCTELVWRSYRPAEDKQGLTFELTAILGRQTLPANEIARSYSAQRGRPDAQLGFVYFLDAHEKRRRSFVATEAAFASSHERSKWDIAQD